MSPSTPLRRALRDVTALAGVWTLAGVAATLPRLASSRLDTLGWCQAWTLAAWLPVAPWIAWGTLRVADAPARRRATGHAALALTAWVAHWAVQSALLVAGGSAAGTVVTRPRHLLGTLPLDFAVYASLVWAAVAMLELRRAQHDEAAHAESERVNQATRLALAHSRIDASGLLRSLRRAREVLASRPDSAQRALHALAEQLRAALPAVDEEREWSVAEDLRLVERWAAFESSVRRAPVVVGHALPPAVLAGAVERLSLFREVAESVDRRPEGEPVFVRVLADAGGLHVEVDGARTLVARQG